MLQDMQCQIRAMSDMREGGRSSKVSDTLPKPGRVNEVCKEWLVHEDGALAYQLQQKEVQEYYTGNKSRNAIVREDFPRARDEQRREEEEALAKYHHMVQMQAERDAKVAKEIAQRIQREEEEQRRVLEVLDKNVASQIQDKEQKKVKEARICHLSPLQGAVPAGDINSVGLPLPTDIQQISHDLRNVSLDQDDSILLDLEQEEERQRLIQEQKDEELARRLQEQEEELDSYDMLDKDRQLAIEAQDKELAKLLQDKERAKAKRARERARQRALLKKQQQQQQDGDPEFDVATEPREHRISRPTTLDLNKTHKSRLPEPEEIETIGSSVSTASVLPNIAMAIDPTYTPSCSSISTGSSAICLPPPPNEYEHEDSSPVPPYMPIQGQRRSASLEKKYKKNKKDGCKQQ